MVQKEGETKEAGGGEQRMKRTGGRDASTLLVLW